MAWTWGTTGRSSVESVFYGLFGPRVCDYEGHRGWSLRVGNRKKV